MPLPNTLSLAVIDGRQWQSSALVLVCVVSAVLNTNKRGDAAVKLTEPRRHQSQTKTLSFAVIETGTGNHRCSSHY